MVGKGGEGRKKKGEWKKREGKDAGEGRKEREEKKVDGEWERNEKRRETKVG